MSKQIKHYQYFNLLRNSRFVYQRGGPAENFGGGNEPVERDPLPKSYEGKEVDREEAEKRMAKMQDSVLEFFGKPTEEEKKLNKEVQAAFDGLEKKYGLSIGSDIYYFEGPKYDLETLNALKAFASELEKALQSDPETVKRLRSYVRPESKPGMDDWFMVEIFAYGKDTKAFTSSDFRPEEARHYKQMLNSGFLRIFVDSTWKHGQIIQRLQEANVDKYGETFVDPALEKEVEQKRKRRAK